MAFDCLNMLDMAIILCEYDPVYEAIACKLAEHFLRISYAMDRIGVHGDERWEQAMEPR